MIKFHNSQDLLFDKQNKVETIIVFSHETFLFNNFMIKCKFVRRKIFTNKIRIVDLVNIEMQNLVDVD